MKDKSRYLFKTTTCNHTTQKCRQNGTEGRNEERASPYQWGNSISRAASSICITIFVPIGKKSHTGEYRRRRRSFRGDSKLVCISLFLPFMDIDGWEGKGFCSPISLFLFSLKSFFFFLYFKFLRSLFYLFLLVC